MVLSHRFVYESYCGIIPDGLVIDHINDNSIDNSLCNLHLVTPKENSLKGVKNRGKNSPPRPVVAINLSTGEHHYFPSLTRAGKELGIHPASVQGVCDNINKSARSNFDDYRYCFEYLD